MMKKILVYIGLLGFYTLQAQVLTESTPTKENGGNFFMEVSAYGDEEAYQSSIGRGLIFPRTNLKEFSFNTEGAFSLGNYYSCYDGMIVYNTATGKTGSNPETQGQQVDITPGFYYFSNPDINGQDDTCTVINGKWVRIGSGATKGTDYKAGEAQPTGEFFWTGTEESSKKAIKRKMLEVMFNNVTYADVTDKIPENAVFLRTQLIDEAGKVTLASVEYRPNSGAEFGQTTTNDYIVARYGQMSTTLEGKHTLIIEYYEK